MEGKKKMERDPIIDRIREIRHKISEKYNHDTKKLIQHYQELEKKSTRKFFQKDNKAA